MKIACVGDCGVDYYENLGLLKPGGIAFNFASALKSLKVKEVSLVSILGKDGDSKKLLKLLKRLKINTSCVQVKKGTAPKQKISLIKGERKFTGYSAGVLKNWSLRKKDIAFIKKHDAVFVPLSDGMEAVFNAVKKITGKVVKAADFSQDYEFADFNNKDNVITKNAKYFDVIFVGGEAKYKPMLKRLAKKYPEKIIVLTLGNKGSLAFYKGEEFTCPAKAVKKVVDTTGCGDAFQAGFLASWMKKGDINLALTIGSKKAMGIIKYIGSTPYLLK